MGAIGIDRHLAYGAHASPIRQLRPTIDGAIRVREGLGEGPNTSAEECGGGQRHRQSKSSCMRHDQHLAMKAGLSGATQIPRGRISSA
jgi:hypothetical protein